MIINIHKQYLLKKLSKKIFLISCIFLILVMIINLIEEANFLKESSSSFLVPILLTFLNSPSLLYEMFPFIFLLSTQFFYIEIYENREIDTLKQFGIDNLSMLKFTSLASFIFGFLIIIVFYNFSSILKNQYLKIKNEYSGDKKYLEWMDACYWDTSEALYDEDDGLFYRDITFKKGVKMDPVDKSNPAYERLTTSLEKQTSKNGAKVFWSRGNG